VKNLEKAPLFIDDTPSLSIFDLRAKARRLVSQHGMNYNCRLFAIDDRWRKRGAEIESRRFTSKLKSISQRIECSCYCPFQLSRAVETRGSSKRPLLSSLRESGRLSKMPILFRFYTVQNIIKLTNGMMMKLTNSRQAEIMIAKHRNGSIENVRLKFIDTSEV
jgi:replicative DNA helicase